ncbi:MAG: hypothetical protein K940chlam9_00757 [Chlamydiae bacterium]|nr:hypothetical protein [Chlamydiota bacterium]
MDLPHILEELAYDMGELPRDAIEAAIVKRTQITPYLLQILEDAVERIDDIIEEENYQGHLYAMYLLAQFREKRAFPLLLRLFCFPGEIPHAIAGDVLTEDLGRILASVCGEDTFSLQEVIENSSLNEYVRAAAQNSLVILTGCEQLPRKEVLDYFQYLFYEGLEKKPSFVWDNLVASACRLYPDEIYDGIFGAYEKRLIDPSFLSLEEVATILAEEKESFLFDFYQESELIEDTVGEMEKWLTGFDDNSLLR